MNVEMEILPLNMIMQIPSGFEWIFIVIIVVVLIFGAKKIPDLARGFGKATSEFEKARIEAKRELREMKNAGTSSSSSSSSSTTNAAASREKLEAIADTLGIDYTDKDDDQLRLAIETEINKSRTKA